MKKKFNTWLIHLLGGVTVNESQGIDYISAITGANIALKTIKDYADSLNGKPADEWCKLMYECICEQLESVSHGADEERPTAHP